MSADDGLFERIGRGRRQRCTVCGREGHDFDQDPVVIGLPAYWKNQCRRGHPFACRECPRAFTTNAARATHERARHDLTQ